jgi:hypothetical protein
MTPLAEHVAWLRDKRDYYDLLWLGDTDHQWLSASRHQLVEAFKHANRLLWAPPDPTQRMQRRRGEGRWEFDPWTWKEPPPRSPEERRELLRGAA